MRLVSWTLAGLGTAPIIGDALRSVAPLVDWLLIIDTQNPRWVAPPDDPNGEPPIYTACEDAFDLFGYAGPILTKWITWPWQDNFAEARNAGLDFAAETGADWACMIDTDERVICPGPAAVRAYLAALPEEAQVVAAFDSDLATVRERFFRLPAKHRWIGRTHEAYPSQPGEQVLIEPSLITWGFLPKTAEQLRAKNERDAVLLAEQIAEQPDVARWRFYLGAALVGLGRHDEAVESYRAAADLDHGETGALACIRAAEILIAGQHYEEAIACCARGMTMRADLAELPWLAAGASWNRGLPSQAEAWALLAKVHGERGIAPPTSTRWVGFRIPRALREGPDEILRLVRGPHVALTPDPNPIRITVTSTIIDGARWVPRCLETVWRSRRAMESETGAFPSNIYVAADGASLEVARDNANGTRVVDGIGKSLLENLLPIWRSLSDDEVIVWLDGDDWLATDHALETVAKAHAAGAWVTYGSFITSRGEMGFAAPVHGEPRCAPWTASHLKTFRAGLIKRLPDNYFRRPDGAYVDLGIDQLIMLAMLEMAGPRAVYVPEVLVVYNVDHSFAANASAEDTAREHAEVARIRAMPPRARVETL